jgi:hypothetical protein
MSTATLTAKPPHRPVLPPTPQLVADWEMAAREAGQPVAPDPDTRAAYAAWVEEHNQVAAAINARHQNQRPAHRLLPASPIAYLAPPRPVGPNRYRQLIAECRWAFAQLAHPGGVVATVFARRAVNQWLRTDPGRAFAEQVDAYNDTVVTYNGWIDRHGLPASDRLEPVAVRATVCGSCAETPSAVGGCNC